MGIMYNKRPPIIQIIFIVSSIILITLFAGAILFNVRLKDDEDITKKKFSV